MRRTLVLTAVAALALCAVAWQRSARADDAETAAVRAAIEHYFRGHRTGQGEHFRKIFHPEARLTFVRDGKLAQLTSEEYISRASGAPAEDEAARRRSIESISIAGDAASVELVLDYPGVKFTDYMSLLKIDGEWKIVNKTFHAERKAQR